MVNKSIDVCTTLLNEEAVEKLKDLIVQDKSSEFSQAKRDVLRHALPEIINHVSDTNVDVAATISEVVVEHTLQVLEKINHKLVSVIEMYYLTHCYNIMVLNSSSCSKKLVPRVKTLPTLKSQGISLSEFKRTLQRRRRRSEFVARTLRTMKMRQWMLVRVHVQIAVPTHVTLCCAVELPSVPLATEGPALQHLGKTRPKPARVQRTVRSSAKRSAPEEASDTATTTTTASDAAPEKTATPDPTPAKVAIKPPPVLEKKKKTEEVSNNDAEVLHIILTTYSL